MKSFYLAAKFQRQSEMRALAEELEAYGWQNASTWVNGGEDGLTRPQIALQDLRDIDNADVIILHTHPRGSKQTGGGRFVEFGYALKAKKQLIVIGEYENVFIHHPAVTVYPTWDAFIANAVPVTTFHSVNGGLPK